MVNVLILSGVSLDRMQWIRNAFKTLKSNATNKVSNRKSCTRRSLMIALPANALVGCVVDRLLASFEHHIAIYASYILAC